MVNLKDYWRTFDITKNNITMHINDIYDSYDLAQNSTSEKFLSVQNEGEREVKKKCAIL